MKQDRWPNGVDLEDFVASAQDFVKHPEAYGYKDDPSVERVVAGYLAEQMTTRPEENSLVRRMYQFFRNHF